MIFASGALPAHAFDDAPRRLDRPALKFARRQHAGPGVEDLQHVGAGLELSEQILDRVLDQHVDDLCKRLRMAIGHHPRRRLVRRALAGHHVGRDRPRRAAKSDQRDLRIELAAHAAQRLEHRLELGEVARRCQRADLVRRIQRIEPRAFAGLEPHLAAERVGNDENVREDDRGIEVEAADRLQRHLGGVFRREAQIEKAARLGAQFAIFRQVTAGLPHHPDRRYRLPAAGKHFEERFNGVILGQVLGSAQVIERRDVASDTLRYAFGQQTREGVAVAATPSLVRRRLSFSCLEFRTLPAQSSGLAIRSKRTPNRKFQTGWGRNSALERRSFELTLAMWLQCHRPYSRRRVGAPVCAKLVIAAKKSRLMPVSGHCHHSAASIAAGPIRINS